MDAAFRAQLNHTQVKPLLERRKLPSCRRRCPRTPHRAVHRAGAAAPGLCHNEATLNPRITRNRRADWSRWCQFRRPGDRGNIGSAIRRWAARSTRPADPVSSPRSWTVQHRGRSTQDQPTLRTANGFAGSAGIDRCAYISVPSRTDRAFKKACLPSWDRGFVSSRSRAAQTISFDGHPPRDTAGPYCRRGEPGQS